jgi:hypothetical protein
MATRASMTITADGYQDPETKSIDLPEDEPLVVKLMIQYFYEGEYDPKLPDGGCMDMVKARLPVPPSTTPKKRVGGHGGYTFTYGFPHSCSRNHYGDCDIAVCPHHICGIQCDTNCREFTCRHCDPGPAPAPTHPPAQGGASQLLLHAKLYEIADKYDVSGLKELAREKFLRACTQFWSSELFAPAAHYAFSTTPEKDKGLRDVISNIISQHMTLLNKPAVEALLTEFNGLALGVLKMRATDLGWTKDA